MARATYENIRKLCSGVFSRKQTLQFAPDTTASRDVSIQLLFSGDSTSLCAHTCETRPLYSLQPMSAGEMNADCFKSLSYEVHFFLNCNISLKSYFCKWTTKYIDMFSYASFSFNICNPLKLSRLKVIFMSGPQNTLTYSVKQFSY